MDRRRNDFAAPGFGKPDQRDARNMAAARISAPYREANQHGGHPPAGAAG
jgi:hypothetical protein